MERPATEESGRTRALWAVIAIGIATAGYLRWAASPYVIDDAYISFRYARNLVEGHGLVFNVGERVEGYTNPLWTLLAAAGIRLGFEPLGFTRAIGVASYVLGLVGCVASIRHLGGARREAMAASLFVLTAVIADGVAGFAGSGMEPTFVGLVSLALMSSHVAETRAALSLRGFACLVGTMTRLDFAPLALASGLVTLARARRDGLGAKAALLRAATAYGLPALVLVAYLAAKTAYYGELLPNTYYAKGADGWELAAGLAYLQSFLASSPFMVLGLPFVLLARMLPEPPVQASGHQDALPFAILGLALHVLYVVKSGGDFMQYRFMVHVLPLALVLVGASLAQVASRVGGVKLAGGVAGLACLFATAPPVLEERFHMESVESMHTCCGPIGVQLGEALHATLPPETHIATSMAGGMPYAARLPTLDMLGLTDATVARGPQTTPTFYRGHMRAASTDYMRERGVNLVIGHPTLCPCDAPCVESVPNVFVAVGDGLCLRSWYLTQEPALTRHLCDHPESFVLSGVACPE